MAKTRRKKQVRTVKIVGRVGTTELPQGEVVEVEHTPVIAKLLKAGYVEEVQHDG